MTKYYKMLFLMTLMIGTLVSVSAYSWMGMWVGLEINLLSMMPLMSDKKSPYSTESSLKYFIIQALSSMILMFSIIMVSSSYYFFMNIEISMILNSALLTKMGMAPFHFWFPEIIDGLNWINCFIILTWQKIAPMMLLIVNPSSMTFLNAAIIISLIIGGILGIKQTSLRKIMVYSSINHLGWMMAAIINNEMIWWNYLVVYIMILIMMITIFNLNKLYTINQIMFSMKSNPFNKMTIFLNFMSLGGLPPFIGFFPKWLTINELIKNNFLFTSITAVLLTLITLYFYTRILFPLLTMNKMVNSLNLNYKIKWINFMSNTINLVCLPLCTMIVWFL